MTDGSELVRSQLRRFQRRGAAAEVIQVRSLEEIYNEVLQGRPIDKAVGRFLRFLDEIGVTFKDGGNHRDWFSADGFVRWPAEPHVTAVTGQKDQEVSLEIVVTPHPFRAEVRGTTVHEDGRLGNSQMVIDPWKLTVIRFLSQSNAFGPPARVYARRKTGSELLGEIVVDFERQEGRFRCVLGLVIPISTHPTTQSEIFG